MRAPEAGPTKLVGVCAGPRCWKLGCRCIVGISVLSALVVEETPRFFKWNENVIFLLAFPYLWSKYLGIIIFRISENDLRLFILLTSS